MRFSARLKKLEATAPRCDRGLIRFVRGDQPPPDADRCPGCGANHVLVVCEIVVATREGVERVRALNARHGWFGAEVTS